MEVTNTATAGPQGHSKALPDAAASIQQIYAKDYGRLCATAAAILHDTHLAQDAVQEAWLRLSTPRVLAGLDASDSDRLRSLVLIAVRHAALNLRRTPLFSKEHPAPEETFSTMAGLAAEPSAVSEQHEAVQALKAALQALEETDRDILLLQYDNGCTGKQIAALLNLREATVRKRSQRAKERLRKILQEGGHVE